MDALDPHKDCVLHHACAPLAHARLVVIAAHGRYGAAHDILKFADRVDVPDVAWVAPQADGGSWWEHSFLAPLAMNEPGLSSAIARVGSVIEMVQHHGLRSEQIVLTGFSQGACLMLEVAARHPRPLRGIVAMSGGLIGRSESDEGPRDSLNGHFPKNFDYNGTLAKVPVHMSVHSGDPVIPIARVRHSADVLRRMGAVVSLETAPGSMHGVLDSDIDALRSLLKD